ncbi:hypothetical protein K6V92_08565 [Cupriavidus respiraculi]|uniref:hypothetical protein n=1 Tax=Cupriavidus respiraculi TaxID=195930 RepID=UPI001C954FF0|nr:hypothetical protein [Cupriavidus respiraculi]MBY4946675.1 hypothetical protein [Cupriavidus respiraculi]
MKVLLRTVLFFNALLYLMAGLLLLVAPFATLYSALQLPQPQPAMYGQLLGVALVGMALLSWQATVHGELAAAVGRTMGQVNVVSAMVVAAWLVFLDLPVQGAGKIWLWLLAAMLGVFALMLLPTAKTIRIREREQRKARQNDKTHDIGPVPATPAARPYQAPEFRREPVVTPPPGYGPGTEVVTEPDPVDTPPAHHARQNPYP